MASASAAISGAAVEPLPTMVTYSPGCTGELYSVRIFASWGAKFVIIRCHCAFAVQVVPDRWPEL